MMKYTNGHHPFTRRIVSLLLAFSLVFGMIAPAFAQEAANQGSSAPAAAAPADQTVQTQADQNAQAQADQNVQAQAAASANPSDVAPRSVTQENGVEVVRFDYKSPEVNVLVTLKNPSDLPADAVLSVTPVVLDDTAQAKVDEQVKTGNRTIQSQKTFDIKFLQNGKEIEPGSTVKVTITLPDMPENSKAEVLHVSDDSQTVENTNAKTEADGKLQLEANSFSRYVIVNFSQNDITVNIKRYVYPDGKNDDKDAKLIYESKQKINGKDVDGNMQQMVTTDLENYDSVKAVQVEDDGTEKNLTPINGRVSIRAEKDVTLKIYYQPKKGDSVEDVTFFDYQVNDSNNIKNDRQNRTAYEGTINQWENYANTQEFNPDNPNDPDIYKRSKNREKDGRIAVGDTKTVYQAGMWSQNNDEKNGKEYNHFTDTPKGTVEEQRENYRIAGVVTGLTGFTQDENTGDITNKGVPVYGSGKFGQIYDPGLFTTKEYDDALYTSGTIKRPRAGKYIIDDFKLKFKKDGDHYHLIDCLDKTGKSAFLHGSYNNETGYSFFPLDDVENLGYGYKYQGSEKVDKQPDGDHQYHNHYFGMRYDIKFKLGDYVGDLKYKFIGDDDMWVILDGQKVVIDLGGIHSALEQDLDLWQVLAEQEQISDKDAFKNNTARSDAINNKWHTLTILYMERGAGRSNCYMDFTIPNMQIDKVSEVGNISKGKLEFNKTSEEIDESTGAVINNKPLAGATFSIKKVGESNATKTATSDSEGKVVFSDIEASDTVYEIKEEEPPAGYVVTRDTYYAKAMLNEDGVVTVEGLFTDQECQHKLENNTVVNYPVKPFLDQKKTAKLYDWNERTYLINLKVGQHVPRLEKMDEAVITDVIDPRFEIIAKDGTVLEQGSRINDLGEKDDNGAGVVSVGEYNGNQCYRVIWEHQSIPGLNKDGNHINEIDYSTWSKNIYIRAKEDYVGGNNVPTNVNPDSNVVVSLVPSEFEQPKVNVKPRLYINDLTKTVFAGDTIYHEDSESKMFNISVNGSKNGMAQRDMIGGKYQTIYGSGKLKLAWYADAEGTKSESPQAKTVTTVQTPSETKFYLKAAYLFDPASDESLSNSEEVKDGGDSINHRAGEENAESGNPAQGLDVNGHLYTLATNGGNLTRNDVFLKNRAADDKEKNYGVYTVHVVKGQIQITKTIDEKYSATEAIKANQTFVFRIDQYEAVDVPDPNGMGIVVASRPGEFKKTFYETISFSANKDDHTKTKLISNLPKGYYVITEETDWSPKYNLKDAGLSEGANGWKDEKSVTLNVGYRSSIDANTGEPTFTGVECYKYNDDKTKPIPYTNGDAKYIYLNGDGHYAKNQESGSNFANMINGNWKWLSDTAAAINQFNQ